MIFSIQPRLYTKLKKSLYAIISLVLVSFIFFVIKYNETSSQKREETLSRILKNNYFLELNKFIFQKVSSPYLNIAHKIKKGENLSKILKSYNIDQKDISKANSELKKFLLKKSQLVFRLKLFKFNRIWNFIQIRNYYPIIWSCP